MTERDDYEMLGTWRLPTPRRPLAAWLALVLLTAGPSGCDDEDRRQEMEICMHINSFAPAAVCGSADDALRVNRGNFSCSATSRSCYIENVRGPTQMVYDTGRVDCCYSYTVVYPDDNSYVN